MKKLILASAVVLAGMAVHAGAIYWQMSSLSTNVGDNWTMARIEEVDSTGHSIGTPPVYLHMADDADIEYLAKGEDGAWFDVSTYESGSAEHYFMVELVNDNLELQGAAAPVAWSDIRQYVVSDFSSVTPVSYTAWNTPDFVGIPEPSGGLLFLLGASLLGLRRRRV